MSSHFLPVEFCNYAFLCQTKIFDSDWVVFTKNIINEVVRVLVVMAVDFSIICWTCMNINILLFSGNKYNVITCHLLIHLGLWQIYSYEQLVSATCASWKKWYRKFGMIYTNSTQLCKKNIKISKKKYCISRSMLDKMISRKNLIFWSKEWFKFSTKKWGNFCVEPRIFCCFCVNIPLFALLFHDCLPNLTEIQVPYISISLCAEKLRLNY